MCNSIENIFVSPLNIIIVTDRKFFYPLAVKGVL